MPTMAEVRAKFPQYNDMSDADLAGALHKKFYADMPTDEFNQKIGFKAPDPLNVKAPPDRGILGGINNVVGGVADAVTQGATLGFADEIGAGGRALVRGATNLIQGKDADLGGTYDRALADIRGRETQFAEEHPVAATTGNVAGGLLGFRPRVLGPGAVAAAPAVKSIPRTLGTATATGAGMGALGGFGAGEGGLENRIASAGTGATVGGLLGAGLPAAGMAASKVLGVGANLLGLRDPKKVALDNLGRALGRDEVTPTAVQDTLNATAKPMAIVDATGTGLMTTNTQRLGRTVETIPGKGSARAHEFLQDRQLGQADRVGDDIATNLSGDDFYKTLDDLNKTRRAAAAPLYDEAYAQPITWNATVETLLDRPSTRQALGRARRIAEEEGRDPRGLGLDLDADGNVALNKTAASMQTLDYAKRGLDDVLETYRDKTTGKLVLDESGKAIDQTRRDFVKSVDDANPKYAEARKAWGGPTQTMEAARLGRDYAKGDAEVTLARFRELSPGDQDAFRLGVARELAGKVENTRDGANSVNRIFGSKGQRSRLQALFPDDASFQAFEKAMSDEMRMSHTRQVVTGNSQTGRIAAEQDDAAGLTNVAMDYAGGGARSVLFGLAGRAASKARGMNEASADELSKMLFSSDRAAQARALVEVQRRQQLLADRAGRGVQAAMAGVAGGSNLAGQGMADR
jgi:hypothetical protein